MLTTLGTSVPMTGTCRLADGDRMMFGQYGDLIVLIDEGGVAAVAGMASASWTPFVSHARAGRVTTVRDGSGGVIATCTETEKGE